MELKKIEALQSTGEGDLAGKKSRVLRNTGAGTQ